jgi:uncharacterized membrane protein YgaE (UPF0421/DUF939 family)
MERLSQEQNDIKKLSEYMKEENNFDNRNNCKKNGTN